MSVKLPLISVHIDQEMFLEMMMMMIIISIIYLKIIIIIIIIIIIYLIVAAHSEVHLTQANPTEPEGVDEQCVI